MTAIHKMVKYTLKILQQMQQDFKRFFDYFVDTRYYRVKHIVTKFLLTNLCAADLYDREIKINLQRSLERSPKPHQRKPRQRKCF